MPAEDSVEQRCARIRGRMVWILKQLENDGSALSDLGDSLAAGSPGKPAAKLAQAQQEAHDREIEEELERQARRMQATHAAELEEERGRGRAAQTEATALRAELAAVRESSRSAQAAASAAGRDDVAAAREATRQAESRLAEAQAAARDARAEAESARAAAAAAERRAAEAERSRDEDMATGRGENEELRARVALVESAVRQAGPLLAHDPKGAQRALEAAVPGCIPAGAPDALAGAVDHLAEAKRSAPPAAPTPVKAAQSTAPPPGAAPSPKLEPAAAKPKSPLAANATARRSSTLPPMHEVQKAQPPAAQPPPKGLRLIPTHVGYTHPGGSKPLDAKNQDTWFHLCIDDHNAVWGVFDGHGGENGTLVAQVAADTVKAHLAAHFGKLRTEPEAVCIAAFELAHEAARRAVLAHNTALKVSDNVPIDEWEDEDGLHQEAADGGTTATVIALLDGATLVHAQVGDSSALLGGTLADGEVTFEELMEEHSATNASEYERVVTSGPRGKLMQFVYAETRVGSGSRRG